MPDVLDGAVVAGEDGLLRCPWVGAAPEYIAYHDDEWGKPVHDERGLYERMMLEAFQSGLSWITILRKREGIRDAFANFVPEDVAAFTDADVARLLLDARIIRNRQKINAAITNAKATIALRGQGGLDALIWSYAVTDSPAPESIHHVPGSTPESTALAKALKKAGFVFVGPTTAYAMMQAIGVVNDHLAHCHAR
ncbi:MAG: DNA-3-methyladenine glycosylase I [Thermomicrobiales bacterium]|nr:DNA-3-methyladenine glycosylase I [Thermomicrobiales bacterium]